MTSVDSIEDLFTSVHLSDLQHFLKLHQVRQQLQLLNFVLQGELTHLYRLAFILLLACASLSLRGTRCPSSISQDAMLQSRAFDALQRSGTVKVFLA